MKKRILIGDDVKIVRMVLRRFLERLAPNSTIIESWDGSSIMDAFFAYEPEVVLLDVELPEIDGWEILRCIREVDPKVKVIMVTSSQTPEDVQKAVELGAAGFVGKPFDLAELSDALGLDYAPLSASA